MVFDPTPCKCVFLGQGIKMDSSQCTIHTNPTYPCGTAGCSCKDYRPNSHRTGMFESGSGWPRCMCGHIAQEH